ncbi:DUF2964 family protein [Paraburkholderia sp. UYCP14C]|uniref:DUF2964 family protein n=1 Tax=Paraburkholderia sp. UYCP14C TaxID=2511130 RepID=UPI001020FDA0|nr:DUF2964 family protein [Paraburkholderia sp. UYCP14C]RZF29628.1 DUF2964 family protein [Paraburkholderia sp. UYCP14C]
MVRDTYQIVLSVIGVLAALGALAWALDGLIFDDVFAFRCGVVIVMASITMVVALLNSQSGGNS